MKVVAALSLLLSACVHDVRTRMPDTNPALAGSLELVFNGAANDVAVVVERRLVVRDADTEHIVIDNVPAGIIELTVVAGSGPGKVERMQRVEIDAGKTTTVPVAAPERSMWRDAPATLLMLMMGAAIKLGMIALL